jgi:penicillin-binding protein 1A
MTVAVANRPIEQFQTQVPMPDWQLTPEEEVYGDQPVDANDVGPLVDENGMPIGNPPPDQGYPQQQPMVRPDGTGEPTQQDLDQAFPPQQQQQQQPNIERYPPPQNMQRYPPRQPGYPPQRQPPPPPGSPPQTEPPQPRPYAA